MDSRLRVSGRVYPPANPPAGKARSLLALRRRSFDRDSHLLENEHAALVGDDDVEQPVAVDVGDLELGADAGVVVDQLRDEGGEAALVLAGTEPVEIGGVVDA